MTPEVINEYKNALEKGETVIENYYVSTSRNENQAFDSNTKYKIISKRGKMVEKLSTFEKEETEVLFKEGTKFKVTKVENRDNGTLIEMEEI